MRRGSIVGPLILILIGGLFLVNNLRPDLSVMDVLGRFWPFLLILWGSLRLVEVLWSFSRGTVPGRGVSGGEWTLIVFICLIGSGVFFAREHMGSRSWMRIGMNGMELFGEPYDYPIDERSVPAAKTARIVVENFRGNVHLKGADVSEVKVSGRKTVRAMKPGEAEEGNRLTPLEIVPSGDTILIRTNQEKWRRDQFVTADLDITVPKGATIQARGRRGDFDINDIDGSVEITSDNAGVRVQNIKGSLRVDLRRSDVIRAVNVKGEVELKGRGDNVELDGIEGQVVISGAYSGDLDFRRLAKPLRLEGSQLDLRVERCPGQIRLARGYFNAEDVVGPIMLNARSKDVQLTNFTQSVDLKVERGDVELRPGKLPLAKMDVTTRSGHIELALPEGAKFNLRARVQKGEVQNNFSNSLQVSNEGRGGTIIGNVGDGPSIVLSSDGGSVTIRKSSGADIITPLPPSLPAGPPSAPRARAPIEEIVDHHSRQIERHAEELGRRIESKVNQVEREIERRADKF